MGSLHYGTKHIQMMALPMLHHLDLEARRALDDYDCFLSRCSGSMADEVLRWISSDFPSKARGLLGGLEHELSPYMEQLSGGRTLRAGGSMQEIATFTSLEGHSVDTSTPLAFQADLLAMSLQISGIGQLRPGGVGTEIDTAGNVLIYPPRNEVERCIHNLQIFLDANIQKSSTFAALVAMNGVFNCHPFVDGNGRVGRLLFNRIAHAGHASFYLPLYELSALSRGGFTIRIRQAQYRGDWTPLCQFLSSAARIMAGLCSAA